MNVTKHSKLSDSPVTEAALRDLCAPFIHALGEEFIPQCVVVQPEQIPYPEDQLLVHHEHMTEVLEKHHGAPLEVQVLEEHLDPSGDFYSRKISLTPRGRPGRVAEWGIVHLDFRYMDPVVKEEILAKRLPLGAVLMKHDVLRRIKPRWFLQFPENAPVLQLFGPPMQAGPAYARIGTIYCNGEPAIQLLEVVLNARLETAEPSTAPAVR